jgi:hypothetical protein
MAKRGRPTVEINLSDDERETLGRWARRHSPSQALALRSRIVLACADGERSRDDIAASVGCNRPRRPSGGTVSLPTASTG